MLMAIHGEVFEEMSVFSSLQYIPRSGISGSRGNSVLNFSRNCQTGFQRAQEQPVMVPISSHPHQDLFVVFFVVALDILMGIK